MFKIFHHDYDGMLFSTLPVRNPKGATTLVTSTLELMNHDRQTGIDKHQRMQLLRAKSCTNTMRTRYQICYQPRPDDIKLRLNGRMAERQTG